MHFNCHKIGQKIMCHKKNHWCHSNELVSYLITLLPPLKMRIDEQEREMREKELKIWLPLRKMNHCIQRKSKIIMQVYQMVDRQKFYKSEQVKYTINKRKNSPVFYPLRKIMPMFISEHITLWDSLISLPIKFIWGTGSMIQKLKWS